MKIFPEKATDDNLKEYLSEREFTEYNKIQDPKLSNLLKCTESQLEKGLQYAKVNPFEFGAFIVAIKAIQVSKIK